jgi:serine/threonine-protein kinase
LGPDEVLASRYKLVRLIGEGGMGQVWEGRQLTTQKPVAIKVLKQGGGGESARFLREARVAAGLSHPNIVQVFDFWEVDGAGPSSVFMVMELLVGETLAARLERAPPLTVDETLAVAVPVASALCAAHAQGIAHRDLKPDNIFLSQPPEADSVIVKVVDFGLAKPAATDGQATAITQTGAVMGTPFYMAPEQVYGEKDVDIRADVWALGVVVFECITGVRPFPGDNPGQVFKRISQGAIPPLRELSPEVPEWLERLVLRMLAHDRDRRPTMTEIRDVLTSRGTSAMGASTLHLTHRLPTPAVSLPLPGPERNAPSSGSVQATRVTAAASVRDARAPHPGRRWVSFAAAGALCVAIGVAASWELRTARKAHEPGIEQGAVPASAGSASGAPSLEAPMNAPELAVASASAVPPASTEAQAAPPAAPSARPKGPSAAPRRPSDLLGKGRF